MTKKSRGKKLPGFTYETKTGCGPMYVTINEKDGQPWEIFTTMGKAGGCATCQTEAISRSISIGLQNGVEPKLYIKQIQGISCHSPITEGEIKILSCADAIAKIFKEHQENKTVATAAAPEKA